jgi:DNA invertase Pin-like site-specific DNA recombinase
MTRRCVLGVRVSTEDKEQDPTNQLLPLRAAALRQGWTVSEEVVISGLSGWNPKTAAEVKRRFLAPILEGRADTLCVWALDRCTRGGIEATLAFIRELEDHLGAALFSLNESWASSATQDKRTREIIVSFMAWLAQQESERKSARVRAKVHAKRNRAGALNQSAKWGKGVLATPDQEAQILVLGRAGKSVRAIAAEVGVSKSQAGRVLKRVPGGPAGQQVLATVAGRPSDGGGLGQPPMPAVGGGSERVVVRGQGVADGHDGGPVVGPAGGRAAAAVSAPGSGAASAVREGLGAVRAARADPKVGHGQAEAAPGLEARVAKGGGFATQVEGVPGPRSSVSVTRGAGSGPVQDGQPVRISTASGPVHAEAVRRGGA